MTPLVGIQVTGDSADAAAAELRDLGSDLTCLHLPWGAVETAPGVHDWSRLDHWNGIVDRLGRPPTPAWFLFPIHMNARGELPADLTSAPLDSTEMLDRWDAWVEALAPRARWDETEAIVTIGNELDLFCGSNPAERDAAIAFLEGATASVRRHAPRARVANTVTWDSIVRGELDLYEAINTHTNVAGFTWYDLDEVTVVHPPTSIDSTLSAMVGVAGGKPVYLQEIAMPTAAACSGDEELQAARIEELFDALAQRPRSEVLAVMWLTIRDWDVALMTEWVAEHFPEFAGDAKFLGFLTSLGIDRADGTAKPAGHAWRRRVAAVRA